MTASERDEQPERRQVRAALGRVIADPILANSPQLVNFLTFIVEETLAGRGDRLKAYAIATDALGRDADFDPQADPIVRVEAARLRHTLERYYATAGRDDPVVIGLPLGRYEPVFRASNKPPRFASLAGLRQKAVETWRGNSRLLLLVVAVAVAISVVFDIAGMFVERLIWPTYNQEATTTPAQSTPTSGREPNR